MLKIENISSKIKVKETIYNPYKSQYLLEPLYRGYGNTVGNALRRIILSSIPGTAIKGVKIESISSEFSTIKGVKENVVDILLNIRGIVLKSTTHGERSMKLSVKGPKVVTAADIEHDATIEIVNKDHVIANITEDIDFNIDFLVDTGESFVVSSDIDKSNWPVGFLAIDAIYSPIKNVKYFVEDTMVGRVTDYDKLVIDVETNGSIETKDIMSYAVELLMKHLEPMLDIGNRVQHLRSELIEEEEEEEEISSVPDLRIEDLDLSVRSYNCLKKTGIETLRDLAKLSPKELLGIKNLGKSSVTEITEKLKEYNIGMELGV